MRKRDTYYPLKLVIVNCHSLRDLLSLLAPRMSSVAGIPGNGRWPLADLRKDKAQLRDLEYNQGAAVTPTYQRTAAVAPQRYRAC